MFVGGRRIAGLAVAAALALGSAACSGTSKAPRTLPPLSTTPAGSASTAPAQNPKAAAVAVVREYFRLINNLENDMNAEGFAKLETPHCPCRKLVRTIREARDRGERYYGRAHVRSLTPVVDSKTAVEVLAIYDSSTGGLRNRAGATITADPGRRGITENFVLRLVGDRWLIANLVPVSSGHR